MPKLSARDALYENLRIDLRQKLAQLPLRNYHTTDGTEHLGHVLDPGLLQQVLLVLEVPLNPPGVGNIEARGRS